MGCWGAGIFQNDDAFDKIANFELDLSLKLHAFPDLQSLLATRHALDSGLTALTLNAFKTDGDDVETVLFFAAILMNVGAVLPMDVRTELYNEIMGQEGMEMPVIAENGAGSGSDAEVIAGAGTGLNEGWKYKNMFKGIKEALEGYQDGTPWPFDEYGKMVEGQLPKGPLAMTSEQQSSNPQYTNGSNIPHPSFPHTASYDATYSLPAGHASHHQNGNGHSNGHSNGEGAYMTNGEGFSNANGTGYGGYANGGGT